MSERRFRLVLAGIMFVTLLLPLNPPPEVLPNWLFILWHSLETLSWIFYRPSGANYTVGLAGWLNVFSFLSLLSAPLLILLNVCLAVRPFGGLKMLYRILMLILLPLTWYLAFIIDPDWRGMGFWANIAVVSAAALLEIFFVARERLRESGDAG